MNMLYSFGWGVAKVNSNWCSNEMLTHFLPDKLSGVVKSKQWGQQ